MNLQPFHLAIAVHDLEEARAFYGSKLGFVEGRSDEHWIDYNMFGHQLVVHLDRNLKRNQAQVSNAVDNKQVPIPHFGVIMEIPQWKAFAQHIKTTIDAFIIDPYVRFEGELGEQCTMFFADPSGNALEFKAFKDVESQLFAK